MAIEQTLSIIKPDAVAKNLIGEIYSRYEKNGLRIVAAKMLHLSRQQAEDFYAVHKARPFYKQLVEFMISGPVIVQVLEGDNAITRHRQLIGATIPKFAAPGTIRYDLAYHNRMPRMVRTVMTTHVLKSIFSSNRKRFAVERGDLIYERKNQSA